MYAGVEVVSAEKRPVLLVPAMNDRMWASSIVQGNVERLKASGFRFIEPARIEFRDGLAGPVTDELRLLFVHARLDAAAPRRAFDDGLARRHGLEQRQGRALVSRGDGQQVEAVGPNVTEVEPGDYVVATVRRPGSSIYDLIGNVWEWTASCASPIPKS